MPSRRAVLAALGVAGLGSITGCASYTSLSRPELRMETGTGILHPASETYIAHGLQEAGDDRVFATVAHDQSPGLVGPDAETRIANELRYPNQPPVTYVVLQLRSTPESPIAIHVDRLGWASRRTLRADVSVRPWGSLDRIEDEQQHQRLQRADELVYTSLWAFTPTLETLPKSVALALSHQSLDADAVESSG